MFLAPADDDPILKDVAKMMDSNNLVESYVRSFRELANYSPKEKRRWRFNFLQELHQKFFQYDLSLIKEILVALFRQVHGQEYSYDHIVFTDVPSLTDEIPVLCSKHGVFFVRIIDHLLSINIENKHPMCCIECVKDMRHSMGGHRKRNTTMFIGDAEIRHGNRFDNRYVKYVNAISQKDRKHITIVCLECQKKGHPGIFYRHPSDHLRNRNVGCPICHKRDWGIRSQIFLNKPEVRQRLRQSRKKPAFVYYARVTINDNVVYKIGVTTQPLSIRMWQLHFDNTNEMKAELLGVRFFFHGMEGRTFESNILNDQRTLPYRCQIGNDIGKNKGKLEKFMLSGNREIFSEDIRLIVPDLFEQFVMSDTCALRKSSSIYYLKIITEGGLRMFILGETYGNVDDIVDMLVANNPNTYIRKVLDVRFKNTLCAKSLMLSLNGHPYYEMYRYKSQPLLNIDGLQDIVVFRKNVLYQQDITEAFDEAFRKNGLIITDERNQYK